MLQFEWWRLLWYEGLASYYKANIYLAHFDKRGHEGSGNIFSDCECTKGTSQALCGIICNITNISSYRLNIVYID